MNLEAENLKTGITESGEIIIEPQYVGFLRENGHTIDAISDVRAIPSESEKSKAYLVCKVQTYELPKDHPDLDLVEHQTEIPVCSCWSYRQNSSDVSEGQKPGGTCKHCESAFMAERAMSDDSQTTL